MEQFVNVAEKELVPLLREKRFKILKGAATWGNDHVLVHRPVPRWIGGTSGEIGDLVSGDAPGTSPRYNSGSGKNSGRVNPRGNVST